MANLIVVILMLSSLMISIPNAFARKPGPDDDLEWFRSLIHQKEKVAKVHFYVQDLLAGKNQSVYEVARASITSSSSTLYGQVSVVDDPLTVRPERDSEEVGRIQGLITNSDMKVSALTMNLNIVFTSGEYNGSTLSIGGRNPIRNAKRELPVIGGTGVFRMARGFAITSTYSFDTTILYGVLEYTIYVSYV